MKRSLIKVLSHLAPGLVVNLAYRVLTSPQVKKLPPHELEVLENAQTQTLRFGEFDIRTYQWGDHQDEKILLVHGWEGQAANFADLITMLVDNNYHVISFDGPSHGFSSKGKTSWFEFSDLVMEILTKYKCKKVVSHSFGGVATSYALYRNSQIEIDKYALLTIPDTFLDRINDVAHTTGITHRVKKLLIERLEKEMDIDVKTLSVSNFGKTIKVKSSLILHDENDRAIPISQSENVAKSWANCKLERIQGTGHFRILRTKEVLDKVLEFMNQ